MPDSIQLDEQFSILSETDRATIPARVLKHGDSFAVFDLHGDIVTDSAPEHGFYHAGTRFVSRLELLLGSRQPVLLSSTISDDNTVFTADLTNPDVVKDGRVVLPRGLLHLFRSRVLSNGELAERIRVSNYGSTTMDVPISLRFDADFADVFEVRGTRRARRGHALPGTAGRTDAVLRYRGLDEIERRTSVHVEPAATRGEEGKFAFSLSLEPHACVDIELSVVCATGDEAVRVEAHDELLAREKRRVAERRARQCRPVSSNEALNRWVQRSSADLSMMVTDTPHGPYPYAGIPWFSTPFGRDGLITAFELLWAVPEVARGVLAFLAETQATAINDAQDAQPGKIVHEMRSGEMAALGEIPFGRYYGTADATPLFVMLAEAYFERTADLAFVDRLWPHILAALDWMDVHGDRDGDGFIEYARRSGSGLIQQGWKDSYDSIFHADGRLAEAPIALCEVQGYAYGAWLGAARLAAARGDEHQAAAWRERAATLQARFDSAFWCDAIGTYALALDADKRPCCVRTSNPGHCLFAGIVPAQRARQVASALMCEASFGGWGVRTVAAGAARYNPMSYHNGSVWPHDNAIAAAGLARYGLMAEASRILEALFDLSQTVDLNRLPELICGFHRRGGDAPTLYPVACAPQAWAAGAVFLLLQACLGLRVEATTRRVSLTRAMLPEAIEWLRIANLSVGDATVDLMLRRHAHDVSVTVLHRQGNVEIVALQ